MLKRLKIFGENPNASPRLSFEKRDILVSDRVAARRPLKRTLRGIVVLISHVVLIFSRGGGAIRYSGKEKAKCNRAPLAISRPNSHSFASALRTPKSVPMSGWRRYVP